MTPAQMLRLLSLLSAPILACACGRPFDVKTPPGLVELDDQKPKYDYRAVAPEGVVVLRSFGEPTGPSPWNQAERDRAMLWGIVDVRRVEELAAP